MNNCKSIYPHPDEWKRLTDDTAYEIAEWCGGRVHIDWETSRIYIVFGMTNLDLACVTNLGYREITRGDFIYRDIEGHFHVADWDEYRLAETQHKIIEEAKNLAECFNSNTAEPPEDQEDYVTVNSIVEHTDGSATLSLTVNKEAMVAFAKVGVLAVLKDEVLRMSEEFGD